MAGLTDTLELDLTEALRGIDTVEGALTQATQTFKVGIVDALSVLSQVEVGADAESVTSAIDAALAAAETTVRLDADTAPLSEAVTQSVSDTEVPVEVAAADLAAVTDDISAAVRGADTTIGVTVEPASTEGIDSAAESLSELDSQAQQAEGALGSVGSAATIVNTTATLAAGQMHQLRSSLPNTGVLGGVATGLAAIAGAASVYASAALDAAQADERWNRTLGESADIVERIDIGGLATDIDALAVSVGSDDEALRLAAAGIFELGVSSGSARPEIEETTERIVALSSRAVALRPALGDAGDVAERLTQALARGGRALVPYGIALSTAEIEARALADTGKLMASDLTVYERAAAGAVLVTERLGVSLGTDIAAGAESGVVRMRSLRQEFGNVVEELGAPVAPTLIRTLEAAQGPLTAVVTVGAELVGQVLPLAVDLLDAAGPAMEGAAGAAGLFAEGLGFVVDLVRAVPDPLLQGVAATFLYAKALRELTVLSGLVTRAKVAETAATIAETTADRAATAAKLEYAGAAGVAAKATGAGRAAAGGLGTAFTGVGLGITAAAAALAVGTVALANHRQEQEETKRRIEETTAAFRDQSTTFAEDITAVTEARFEELSGSLRDTGLTFADVEDFALRGTDGVAAFVTQMEAAGRLSDGAAAAFRAAREGGSSVALALVDIARFTTPATEGVYEVATGLERLQSELQKGARAELDFQLAAKAFTPEALAAAEAHNTLADGAVDYLAVLRDLVPEQLKSVAANAANASAADAAADGAAHLLDRFTALTIEQDAFLRGLDLIGPGLLGLTEQFAAGTLAPEAFRAALANTGATTDELLDAMIAGKQVISDFDASLGDALSRTLDEVGPKFGAVADQAIRGTLTHKEFLAVVARTRIPAEQLNAALDIAKESVRGFADEVAATVPSVQDAFDDLGKKPGLKAFVDKVEDQAKDLAGFADNVAELFSRGATDLAAALLEQGPTTEGAAVAAQAARLGGAALAAQEREFDRAEASRAASQRELEALAIRHGERMVGIQTTNNTLLSAVPAPDLATPLITAEERAADSLRTEGRRLMRLAARDVVAEVANIEASQFTRVHSRGQRLGRELATGVIEGTDQSAEELFRAGERAASAVDRGLRAHLEISSPSRVGRRRGASYTEGVALGVADTGPVDVAVTALAARVSRPLVGVASVAVAQVAPVPAGAGTGAAAGGAGGHGDRLVSETAAMRAQGLETLVLLRRLVDAAGGIGDATADAIRRTGTDGRFLPAAMRG